MMTRPATLLSLLLFLATLGQARADVIFKVDLDTVATGVQSSRTVTAGETFDIDLLMEITGSNTVSAFSFQLAYDAFEVTFGTGDIDVSNRPAGFSQVSGITVSGGTAGPFDGINLGTPLDSSFSGLVGRISVTALSPSSDMMDDFLIQFANNGVDSVLDGATNLPLEIGVTPGDGGVFFEGSSLNAVPEPGSLLLLAGVALIAVYRRKQSVAV